MVGSSRIVLAWHPRHNLPTLVVDVASLGLNRQCQLFRARFDESCLARIFGTHLPSEPGGFSVSGVWEAKRNQQSSFTR